MALTDLTERSADNTRTPMVVGSAAADDTVAATTKLETAAVTAISASSPPAKEDAAVNTADTGKQAADKAEATVT